jgi:hypothetical protein
LIERLIDGDFSAEEQPDGHLFIYLFEDLCLYLAKGKATEEIYVDDVNFPEIWDFVWGAGETRYGLPLSPYGGPAVGYWGSAGVKRFIAAFAGLDHATLKARTDRTYADEIARLLAVLKEADRQGRGVFVFFNE